MAIEIDTHQAIAVFQLIHEHGSAVEGGHVLNGVLGCTDYDGYTVFLSDEKVSLTIYFHYKYKLEYKYDHELESFVTRLRAIENTYSRKMS